MLSLKDFAAQCIGLSGDFSVVRNFFGHREGQPRTSSAGSGRQISLLDQIKGLQGHHIHLDIILVGSDQFLTGHKQDIDYAVFKTREIFAQVHLGVGRIAHHHITTAEADGLEHIEKKKHYKKLGRKYRGSNDDAIDVFVVLDFDYEMDGEAKAGIAPIGIPDNKDIYHFDGVVMGIRSSGGVNQGAVKLGMLLAHELGHCLSLRHVDYPTNLMFPSSAGSGLSADQGADMRSHDYVQPGC